MIYIINESNDPHFNLALEEYVIKEMDPDRDYFILWQNSPAVIVGKSQNTIEEINQSYVEKYGIHVVRRLSGGGAVYHDLGNLNFTFITTNTGEVMDNFKKFTEPVIQALASLGVKAEFNSRNDLTIDGKKFSGNAQYYYQKRILHHGTLLYNSDLECIGQVLNVKAENIASKGVKYVRSRVTNIMDYLPHPIPLEEFKEVLVRHFGQDGRKVTKYCLADQDLARVNHLVETKYATWEWNYGRSPDFNLKKSGRFAGGYLEFLLEVQKGYIKNCKIYGDFFGEKDVQELEEVLHQAKYEREGIKELLQKADYAKYFSRISLEEVLSCII